MMLGQQAPVISIDMTSPAVSSPVDSETAQSLENAPKPISKQPVMIPGNPKMSVPIPDTLPPPQNVPSFKFVEILIKAFTHKNKRKNP